MTDLSEGFWSNLLDYIEDRTVIPVIGSELVTVREGDRDVPLDHWLAGRLAADLGLPVAELPPGFDLNDAVSLHVRRRGEREELYAHIHRLLRTAALPPSEPLRALAGIPGFNLFVSLTFDALLAEALGAEQIAYAPNKVRDLPGPKADLGQPVVFHLLGKASASPDYAICDEDVLEHLHGLQDKQRQPKILFDELRGNHLLILGCSFGDWLARFFLRTARGVELSQKRRRQEMLVGDQMTQDAGLTLFLDSFSTDARMIPTNAADFVLELASRWHAAHPPKPASAAPVAREAGSAGSVPDGAVFVSYASEDLDAASRLVEGLRAAGLEVWFDRNALKMGDDWARSIRRGIERCSLFVPVVSRQSLSEANRRRYFWREWNDAADFAQGMAPDEAFLVPVVIDDSRIDRAPLPEAFKRAQGRTLPEGNLTPGAAERLVELVRDFHRRRRAA
ncbi:MAG TPA: molecular chaperone Tir [Acidobacteria bacterium]|nr:molecular chaperone Tir [Acidobacteriota bacterium]